MPQRPGEVTAAAVLLIVLGILVGLFGAIALLAGFAFPSVANTPEFREQFGDVSEALGGLLISVGGIVLAYGVAQLVSGIFILPGRTWARLAGLIVAVLGILLSLVGVLPAEGSWGAGNVVFLLLLLAYAFAAWVLASRAEWFSR